MTMDFAKYTNTMEYPVRSNFSDAVAFQTARNAYRDNTARLVNDFRDDLFTENGLPYDAFSLRLWEMAWANGHSSGFAEVENYFNEYAELYELAESVFQRKFTSA